MAVDFVAPNGTAATDARAGRGPESIAMKETRILRRFCFVHWHIVVLVAFIIDKIINLCLIGLVLNVGVGFDVILWRNFFLT